MTVTSLPCIVRLMDAKHFIDSLVKDGYAGNASEFAREIGVTPQAVQQWIAGVTEPRPPKMRKIQEIAARRCPFLAEAPVTQTPLSGPAASMVNMFQSLDARDQRLIFSLIERLGSQLTDQDETEDVIFLTDTDGGLPDGPVGEIGRGKAGKANARIARPGKGTGKKGRS